MHELATLLMALAGAQRPRVRRRPSTPTEARPIRITIPIPITDHHPITITGVTTMIAETHSISHRTRGNEHIVDLTDEIQRCVSESRIRTGQAAAMVVGSTASLSTLEFEPGLVEHDIAAALERLAPRAARYAHEETWHDDNGHSHVRACIIGPALALPIRNGRIPLGTWQQIVLLDFDTRAREREVVLSLLGVGDE